MTEEIAIFAGGCFWCMQPPFDNTKGVIRTTVGYTGGHKDNPTYEEVCQGTTGHAEAIEIIYDSGVVSYSELLNIFWRNIDPTQLNGQFADIGSQYRTEIFYTSERQKELAEISKKELALSGKFTKPIVTAISPAQKFWPAEEYHQKYYLKRSGHYQMYKQGSGRQRFIEQTWK